MLSYVESLDRLLDVGSFTSVREDFRPSPSNVALCNINGNETCYSPGMKNVQKLIGTLGGSVYIAYCKYSLKSILKLEIYQQHNKVSYSFG